MRAMQNKTADVALLLLEHNADATAKDRYATTLMHAAANNQASLIEPLVARGADINARNDEGQTDIDSGDKKRETRGGTDAACEWRRYQRGR